MERTATGCGGSAYREAFADRRLFAGRESLLPEASADTPVITMDFYPTILNATGAKGNADHNQEVDGVDISAVLKDPNAHH